MTNMELKTQEAAAEKVEVGKENRIITSEQILAEINDSKNELENTETQSSETASNMVISAEKATQEMNGDPNEIMNVKNEVANLENQKKDIANMSRAEIEALMQEEGKEKPVEATERFSNLVENNSFKKGIEDEQQIAGSFAALLNEKPPERKFLREQHFDQWGQTKMYEVEGKEYNEYSSEIKALGIKNLEWENSTDKNIRGMNRFQWNEATNLLNQNPEQAKKSFTSINEALSERMRDEEKIEILKNIPGNIAGDVDKIDFRNFTEVLPTLAKRAANNFEEAKKEIVSSSGDKLQDDWNKSRALGRFVEDLALFDKLNTPVGGAIKEGHVFSAVAEQKGVNQMDMEATKILPTGSEELKNMRNFARENILKITSENPENLTKVLDLEFVKLNTDSRGNENDNYANGKNKAGANLANIIDSGILSKSEVKTMLQKVVETIKNEPDKIMDKDTVIGSITALEGTGSLTKEEIKEILGA